MSLPANFSKTSTTVSGTGDHPEGTFLFQGGKGGITQVGGVNTFRYVAINIYGKKHEGKQVYCIEMVATVPNTTSTRTHSWKTAEQYESSHLQMWRHYDMEPNRDFNTGKGFRSEGGEHLDGGNELCEHDGRMKKANIEAKCT